MRSLSDAIRAKRYKLNNNEEIKILTQAPSGDIFSITLEDCSLSGFSGYVNTPELFQELELYPSGTLFESAKLNIGEKEFSLGRIVLRRLDANQNRLAFSTVDSKLPVDKELSAYIDSELENSNSFLSHELNNEKFSLAHFVESEFANVDLFDRVDKFSIFLNDWKKSDKYGYLSVRTHSKGPRINLERMRSNGRNDYILMGSNDYLGLASHPKVVEKAKEALDVYGFGSTGSAPTTGVSELHNKLSETIATMHKRENAVLFNSGYAANLGIIASLVSDQDLIVADQLSHASIQDAMKLSRANCRFFKHNSAAHLERVLKKERSKYKGCLVITEGVFSMDGDVPPLDKIYEVARKYQCRIMLDQAHCFGVVGPKGLGAADKYNLLRKVDIIMGTFSKIGGGIGGFAVGDQEVIDWITHFARSFIFSVSLPPSTCAAMLESLRIFKEEPEHLQNLRKNIKHFKNNLKNIGYNVPDNHESAVVPVIIGDEKKLGEMYQSMLEDGVFVVPIVYPAVSRTNCRFRFTVMATHSVTDLDYATSSLEKAMLKANFTFENKGTQSAA